MAHVIDFKEAGFDSVLDELEWRGLISQSTDRDRLAHTLNGEPVHYYCGFDPTAPSLHIGNLVQLIIMRHLQEAGHHPIALVGGATGLIGDPRQSGERILNPKDIVEQWCERLRIQIGGILEQEGSNPVTFDSNYDWTATMNVLDILRDIGKNFRVGTMISKDIVARRLNSEEGISFTEFSYQVLQGNDYLYLYDHYDCVLELGGYDQRGNLTSSLDLIHKVRGVIVYAMASPIITDANGKKFGKSEGNAVWLAPNMLSVYKFYQFWLNRPDVEMASLLKAFTFLPKAELARLHHASGKKTVLEKVTEAAERREQQAQKKVKPVHGVLVEGLDNCLIKFSRCCTPIPGDDLVGYITRGQGVSIHRTDCANYARREFKPEDIGRWINVSWADEIKESYATAITVVSRERNGLIMDIASIFNTLNTKVRTINARDTGDKSIVNITLETSGIDELRAVVNRISALPGVVEVKRNGGKR